MAETKSLAASVRSGVGKGAARSVRREGRIPAVVYGGGEAPTPIALSWHEVNKLIYAGGFMTTTFDLEIDGRKERVIPRDYQLDPIKDKPLHVDFLRLKAGQKIDVEIPVHVVNEDEAPGLKQGGVVNIVRHAIELKVAADAIPEAIEIDIAGMEIGDSKHLSDLKLPRGTKLTEEGDFTVLTIAPPVEEIVDEPIEEPVTIAEHGGDEAEAAEGEDGDKAESDKADKKDD